MQYQQRRRSGGPSPCVFHLRGHCRFGTACRFSHEPVEQAETALPFHHRQTVQSQANASLAASASAAAAAASAASPAPAAAAASGGAPWRFRVMSYNVLADCLAHEHSAELYASAPRFSLEWGYRGGLILREVLHHLPHLLCLQEVDHFRQFQQALQPHGYEGVYTKRTGDRRDGLAMFWRTDALRPVKQQYIQYSQMGMKDNVAQLLVFEPSQAGTGSGSSGGAGGGAGGAGAAGSASQTSSEGSAGSLSGQKRRQAEPSPAAGRHLRFDSSDSEGEGDSAGSLSSKRRGSLPGGAAAAAALQAISIEDATEPAAAAAAAAGSEAAAAVVAPQLPTLVAANIHVLFNPKRGDLKMGQVRTLLEHVDSLCLQQQKRSGQRAAAIVCGDFNSAAGSPIWQFVRSGQLDLSQHDRRRMSGQVETSGHNWRALQQEFLDRQQHQQRQAAAGVFDSSAPDAALQQQQQQQQGSHQGAAPNAWPGQPPGLLARAAVASLTGYSSSQQGQPVPPYAPPEPEGVGNGRGSSGRKSMRAWGAEDTCFAAGSGATSSGNGGAGSALVARHPLHVESAYGVVTGAEAAYSTCHDKFIGCVDYMWFTPSSSNGGTASSSSSSAGGWRLLPLSVVQPPPLETLHCALPSPAWPSDHISLVCDFALVQLPSAAEQSKTIP